MLITTENIQKHYYHIKNIISLWTTLALKEGFNGIHFMRFLGPFNNNIIIDDINAYVNFEPGYNTQLNYNALCLEDDNKIFNNNIFDERLYLNKNNGRCEMINNKKYKSGYDHYKSISEN